MKLFLGGGWFASHPVTSRDMKLAEGSLDAEGHVGGGKTRERNRRRGDVRSGVWVTSGKIA